jgi:hypothetical protein
MNELIEESVNDEFYEETTLAEVEFAETLSEDDLYPGSFFRIPAPPTPSTAWRLA